MCGLLISSEAVRVVMHMCLQSTNHAGGQAGFLYWSPIFIAFVSALESKEAVLLYQTMTCAECIGCIHNDGSPELFYND